MPDELKMSFDPLTIEHLGVKMYSHIPNAIAELVANAYDADAKNVQIKLYETDNDKKIQIVDDGIGMDFDEINSKFLRIGRNRRKDGAEVSPGGRKATGKKGLGKLALFGIGDLIEVSTIKKETGKQITFSLSWENLKRTEGRDYKPEFEIESCDVEMHGTTITLCKLRRESPFDKASLANSIARLFNCFSRDFKCFVTLNNDEPIEVNNELKYKNIESQFEWEFPSFSQSIESDFPQKGNISGKIISTEKPISPNYRGITLFANGRLVNTAEFFGVPESSHVFSYLTGWLNIDFIDELEEDVISTNRQSLNWELPAISELRKFLISCLRKVIVQWREKRNEASKQALIQHTHVDTEKWFSALPAEVKDNVEAIVDKVISDSDMPTEKQASIISMIHEIMPEYPYYHYRHLHTAVQDASKKDYESNDYYRAFLEAIKRYINIVKETSGSTNHSEASMMGEVFGDSKRFTVTKKYKKPDGGDFSPSTITTIEEGQKYLSMGIVSGARNPLSHSEIKDLRGSNLFNEFDCLDALSLLSHLFRRLDDAIESLESPAQPPSSS